MLTPQAYAHLDELATRLRTSLEATIARHGFDWHVVSVGAKVTAGQTLLIIEAMKTFNPIKAPRAGRVAQILIDNAQPVEFDQPLMIVE